MMKKIFYCVSTVFQVLLLISAFGIQFFSMRRMGMMRYVLFINNEWEAQYPVAALKNAAIVFLILLSVAIILYLKIRKGYYIMGKKLLSMLIAEVIITIAFVFFVLAYSTESYRSYYFTGIILSVTALIQDIKIFVYLIKHD